MSPALTERFFINMTSGIGAGSRIYLGTGAVPVLPFTTASAPGNTNVTAYEMSDYLKNVNVTTTQGTVDVTKLSADKDAFFRKHIAGLNDANASGGYGDDFAGTLERRVQGIQQGTLHPRGRGKVDIIIRPHGDGAGLIQYRGTVSIPSISSNDAIEDEVGGDISYKFDGPITKELQV